MATKKRKGKGKSGSDPLSQLMGFFGRADVMGVALMLISIFTLLSLFTGSRGSLTGAWIDGLEQAFGVGVWGFPLVTAALALWLVIHAMERMEDMAWQRPLGAALLFIAFVTGANRLMEGQVTDGGGWPPSARRCISPARWANWMQRVALSSSPALCRKSP